MNRELRKVDSRPLALTLGEPAGIGPDIAIKAWLRREELKLPAFYLLGDRNFLERRAAALGLHVRLADVDAGTAGAAFADALPVVSTGQAATAEPGQPDAQSAQAALSSIRQAVKNVRSGLASAVVTNPIAKSVLYRAGFRHPGHTEYLAELAADKGQTPQPVMMLWSPVLAVVPVTIHASLREVIREHALSARKSLGQNFLLDLNLTARIARAAGPLEGATVVEIGPGPGGLTRAMLALGATHVIAVEHDTRAIPALEMIGRRYPGRLEIVCADALTFDPRPYLGSTKAKIVANLPYNIATALLIGWLSIEPWPPWYDMMVLMFQREVAERIVARENDEAYGRLGVLANWRCETKILFDISPAAFVPQPKVTSSVVRLLPRAKPEACERRALEQVAAAAFGQRRKMLRQSLKSLPADPARLAAAAQIDPTRRAETIPISGFVAMARELANIRGGKQNTS